MNEPEEHTIEKDLTAQVISEKLYSAESYSASVRLILVLINTIAYVVLMDKADTIPWLAYTVITISLVYSFSVVIYRPFDRFALNRTSYFTFLSDGLFIVLWIVATGSSSSPFYLLWYVSVIAVGQRFSFRSTLLTAAVYALAYVIILKIDIGPIASADMFLRVLYIPIIGVLAAYFSREFENQVEDKLKARVSELTALEAQAKQQELLTELRSIQKELELRVEERTAELNELNKNLTQEIYEKEDARKAQKQTLLKLERSNTELQNFAYVTSHDLKAPLRGISTIADWLQEDYADKLDEDGKNSLLQLKQRTKKMNDLIEGILKYSKVGVSDEAFEAVDMAALVTSGLDDLIDEGRMRKMVNGTFPKVEYNRILLQQVVQNLLSNAFKFTAAENGVIEISGKPENEEWTISISDNGKGIPVPYRDKIFGMFQTLEDKNTTDSTGVGLAIVKKVVNEWGGNIWVDESQYGGARFTFTIPTKMIIEQ